MKLWSYADLMGLRIIYWLRQPKSGRDGHLIPRTAMPAVRRALEQLDELDLELWSEERGPSVAVDRAGNIVVVAAKPYAEDPHRQGRLPADPDVLEVIAPFEVREGFRGPDLQAPRPQLRIVPGKLGGSPHVMHTRVESQALGALASSGLDAAKIHQLYPDLDRDGVRQALDLERQLSANLRPLAAAA